MEKKEEKQKYRLDFWFYYGSYSYVTIHANWHIQNAPFCFKRDDIEIEKDNKNIPKWVKKILKQNNITSVLVDAHKMSIFRTCLHHPSGIWRNAKQCLVEEGVLDKDAMEIYQRDFG